MEFVYVRGEIFPVLYNTNSGIIIQSRQPIFVDPKDYREPSLALHEMENYRKTQLEFLFKLASDDDLMLEMNTRLAAKSQDDVLSNPD